MVPEIILPDEWNPSATVGIVTSYMIFPRSEEQRISWFACFVARQYWELEKEGATERELGMRSALRCTPAMAAGIARKPWSVRDLVTA
jgi:hypothetical protein